MLMENMAYFAQRLPCTDAEKDSCLDTVVKLLHLWEEARQEGYPALGGARADSEPDPFFQACLRDAAGLLGRNKAPSAQALFAKYLVAGDYHGREFLRNVVIVEGVALLSTLVRDEGLGLRDWGEQLSLAVQGYFGAEYRDKLVKTIQREIREQEKQSRKVSVVPEFDALADLPQALCARLWRDVPDRTMAVALKYAGAAARDRLMSVHSPEYQEQLEKEMELLPSLRQEEVETAQREVLEKSPLSL